MPNSCVALIPLRGGSKSITKKNIKKIAGRPLVYWVLDAACHCKGIERVFVSTDDFEIAEVVQAYGNELVEVVGRSPETATDTASTESVMLEFAASRIFDHLVLIQATSPLLTAECLQGGLKKYFKTGADSLLSVVEQKRFIWQEDPHGGAQPVNYDPLKRPRRQDFKGQLVENGAFYICSKEGLQRTGSRLFGRVSTYVMPEDTYFEIDEPSDWTIVEGLIKKSVACFSTNSKNMDLSRIKMILTDVDGVLTDAGMYYSETGDESKKFNTHDGKGIELARNNGIKVGIITSENTKIVERRAHKLKIDYLFQGVTNKIEIFERLLSEVGLDAAEVAYIGDDINDLEVLKKVGFSAAPSDAVREVKSVVDMHCEQKGGGGCLREMIDHILSCTH